MPDSMTLPLDDLPPLPGEAEGADHPDDAALPDLRAVSPAQHDYAYGTRRRLLRLYREYLAQSLALVRTWEERGEPLKAEAAQRDLERAERGFERARRSNSASWWLEVKAAEPHVLLMGLGEEPEGTPQ